jgi:hypothetical protein
VEGDQTGLTPAQLQCFAATLKVLPCVCLYLPLFLSHSFAHTCSHMHIYKQKEICRDKFCHTLHILHPSITFIFATIFLSNSARTASPPLLISPSLLPHSHLSPIRYLCTGREFEALTLYRSLPRHRTVLRRISAGALPEGDTAPERNTLLLDHFVPCCCSLQPSFSLLCNLDNQLPWCVLVDLLVRTSRTYCGLRSCHAVSALLLIRHQKATRPHPLPYSHSLLSPLYSLPPFVPFILTPSLSSLLQ